MHIGYRSLHASWDVSNNVVCSLCRLWPAEAGDPGGVCAATQPPDLAGDLQGGEAVRGARAHAALGAGWTGEAVGILLFDAHRGPLWQLPMPLWVAPSQCEAVPHLQLLILDLCGSKDVWLQVGHYLNDVGAACMDLPSGMT